MKKKYDENDIDIKLAIRAYQNISFDPDLRGKQTIIDYVKFCEYFYGEANNFWFNIESDINKEIFENLYQKSCEYYLKIYKDWLGKKSGCFSAMVTGPSNFNESRHKKCNNAEHKALEIVINFEKTAMGFLLKKYKKKIKKYNDNTSPETEKIYKDNNFEAVNNRNIERIQIFFNSKPNDDIIKILKTNAWRWSPSVAAWQRKNTNNGINNFLFIKNKIIEKIGENKKK